jgi:hypothetical protein
MDLQQSQEFINHHAAATVMHYGRRILELDDKWWTLLQATVAIGVEVSISRRLMTCPVLGLWFASRYPHTCCPVASHHKAPAASFVCTFFLVANPFSCESIYGCRCLQICFISS